MQTVKLQVEPRSTSGKGPARQLRNQGKVPAVFYGRGVETASLAVSPKELRAAVSGALGVNEVLGIEVGGTEHPCLLADYQVHPLTREILHADFMKVEPDRRVNIEVPLTFTGKAKGIILGGKLRQVFLKVPITCLPTQIPAALEHDVTELGVEDIVRVRDLKLPEGVEVRYNANQTLGGLYGARKRDEAEEEKTEAAPGAPAKAAPAKAAAAKAAPAKAPAKK